MATGPEHYRAAEVLLEVANAYDQDNAPKTAASRRAEALVHAILAQAAATVTAATAATNAAEMIPSIDLRVWFDATGPKPGTDTDS